MGDKLKKVASQEEEPTRYRRPSRSEVRRGLLDAAHRVMAEQGYEDASLDQIAAAAGYSKGAVYSNFKSKADLFLALLDSEVLKRVATIRSVVEGAKRDGLDPSELVRLLGAHLSALSADDPAWQTLFIDFWRLAVRDPDIGAAFVAHRRMLRSAIADAVRESCKSSSVEINELGPDEIATSILAISNGLAIERLTDTAAVPDSLFGNLLIAILRPNTPNVGDG